MESILRAKFHVTDTSPFLVGEIEIHLQSSPSPYKIQGNKRENTRIISHMIDAQVSITQLWELEQK